MAEEQGKYGLLIVAIMSIVAIVAIAMIVITQTPKIGVSPTAVASASQENMGGQAIARTPTLDKTYQECYTSCTDPPSCYESSDCRRGCHMGCSQ